MENLLFIKEYFDSYALLYFDRDGNVSQNTFNAKGIVLL